MVSIYLNNSAVVKPGWVSMGVVKWAINRAMQKGMDAPDRVTELGDKLAARMDVAGGAK